MTRRKDQDLPFGVEVLGIESGGGVVRPLEQRDIGATIAQQSFLFGTPSHYGTTAAGLKAYIDSTGDLWRAGRLADKVYGAFVSSASTHGGQETTLTNFTTIFTHWGGIIVPPGFTADVPVAQQMQLSNPHGAGHVAGFGNPPTEFALGAARFQAGRAVEVAARLRPTAPAERSTGYATRR